MWVPSRVWLNGLLSLTTGDASIALAKTLDGAWLALLNAPLALTIDSDSATVKAAEANYQGYARQHITSWTGPFTGQGGFSLVQSPAFNFFATGSDSPNMIYGQALFGSDSATYLGAEMFDAPISLAGPANSLVTVVIIGPGPNAQGYGSSIVTG